MGEVGQTLQLSWYNGAPHLWAVDPSNGVVAPPFELARIVEREVGRHVWAVAMPVRIPVERPGPGSAAATPSLRISVSALAEIPRTAAASPSLRWFGALLGLAEATVRGRRIRPGMTIDGPIHVARWSPLVDHTLTAGVEALAKQQPPVCGVDDVEALFASLVDAVARRGLADMGWRPPRPTNGRGTEYRAAQATFRALSSASGSVLYRNDDQPALAHLGRSFDHERDRATGVPVVAAQVRLHIPDTVDEEWHLTLELVDVDQPERWATAADIAGQTPLAADLARQAAHLPRLHAIVLEAAATLRTHLAPAIAAVAEFVSDPTAEVAIELDDVETLLTVAPEILASVHMRLLGPEQLIRTKAGVRAAASPKPDGATGGRFAASALVQWNATVDDTPIDEAQLARAAMAGNSLIHANGRWVRIDAQQVEATLRRLEHHREADAELDIASLIKLAADAAAQEASAANAVAVQGSGWIGDILAGLPDEQLVEIREPDGFVGELRHYQRRGLSWMAFLGRLGLGGCLADDMGLGKTATTLAHIATRPGPHLVVCPLSVVHNWYAESARFTPNLQVSIHHGNERARGDAAADELIPADIVVTTYGLLSRDIDTLAAVPWGTVVLDEAQAVKNHLTNAAKAIRRLQARQKIALTGTPVENHLGELWSILDAVNPGLFGSVTQFADRYAKPIQRNADPAATAALRALTQPFILRRTKADKTLIPELPDKIEQIAWATLTREQATMYQAVVERLLADARAQTGMKRRGLVLAALTRLKQICNHPAQAAADGSRIAGRSGKLHRFDELVDDLLAAGERALVFTQFREMGLLLQRHLRDRLQFDVPFLHGGVSRGGRDAMVQSFQAGIGSPLLIVSLKAGGTGLNLTAATQVIHYDRWWNPAVEDQATDRAWRIGQSHTVLVHKLVCEGTLEERISQLIDDKRALATSVLGTGEQWLSELSTDDLRALVAFDPGGPR